MPREEEHTTTRTENSDKKLPSDLQNLVDKDTDFFDSVYEGQQVTTDVILRTSFRYAAYASRARTILTSAHRYIAYTSDVGESFRPIAHPWLVRGAYGISWAYLIGDVTNEGYKAYRQNQEMLRTPSEFAHEPTQERHALKTVSVPLVNDYRAVMAKRAAFQGVASMGLPALTIHAAVKHSGRALKDVRNVKLRTWGPIGLGLGIVPALPYIFDKPVHEATEWLFDGIIGVFDRRNV